jgi:predicted HicB family RNase H-like nuclease
MTAAQKNVTITLRITVDEHAAWVAAATADDRSLSGWIRKQCNAGLLPRAAPGPRVAKRKPR